MKPTLQPGLTNTSTYLVTDEMGPPHLDVHVLSTPWMLGLVEMSGQWAMFVPWIAIAFAVVRVSHALGLSISAGVTPFRFLGAVGTALCILGLAVLLAIGLVRDTHWLGPLLHG